MYLNPQGQSVTEAEATLNGALRDGYRVHYSVMMMDVAPGGGRMYLTDKTDAPKSIDEAVKQTIESSAKTAGQTPSEWLASRTSAQIEKLASEAASRFVQSAGGAGVARAFAMDAAGKPISSAQAMHDAIHGRSTVTAHDKALMAARTAAQLAAIDAHPSRAWKNDPKLQAAKQVCDLARMMRHR